MSMSIATSDELTQWTQPNFEPVFGRPTWEIACLYPAQGCWDESEYLSIGTAHLIEFDNGFIEVLPMPTPLHQRIVQFLFEILKAYVTAQALGEVFVAPLPIRLWIAKYREPDLVFVRPGRIRSPKSQPDGADLVMEVMSEGDVNRDRDLVKKRGDFARAGIAEYWIVDPEEHRITVLVLDGQAYRVHGEFGRGACATSVLLSGFGVSVDEVFDAGTGPQA
jgi:Uma2 family endonuclease